MNYIWDYVINAERGGIPQRTLRFLMAEVYSAYMELSPKMLNLQKAEPEIEINPYYRFYEIFRDYFHPDNQEDVELRNALFNMVIHFLADIDRRLGMTKTEYYIRFILADIKNGSLGVKMERAIPELNLDEQDLVARNVYRLYRTGAMIDLLKDTIIRIFPRSIIYVNYEVKEEILLFLEYEPSSVNLIKLDAILDVFLPLRFRTEIYWDYHFGIIDNDEAMKVDSIALY
jgi:hypothetical protein